MNLTKRIQVSFKMTTIKMFAGVKEILRGLLDPLWIIAKHPEDGLCNRNITDLPPELGLKICNTSMPRICKTNGLKASSSTRSKDWEILEEQVVRKCTIIALLDVNNEDHGRSYMTKGSSIAFNESNNFAFVSDLFV
ncbi:hypothetical protein EGR_10224 [Echinococcus granulosus]|uniref:Uncharacterized protein n=1 Tax=Echinococcus granulosus TaxID=6210 RepID=W6UN03_ECHGR|nr:hypothetical protein EGR_10224 [Echinococcus granulosus]EUB54914.1 hypothetical protein EGR_10224 [Echinococcus granulosus]